MHPPQGGTSHCRSFPDEGALEAGTAFLTAKDTWLFHRRLQRGKVRVDGGRIEEGFTGRLNRGGPVRVDGGRIEEGFTGRLNRGGPV